MSSESWERLVYDLRMMSGWTLSRTRETLVSVLCVLDQSVFCNGRGDAASLAAPFRLLRRCSHHRGVRPRLLSRDEMVQMVADDLDIGLDEAETSIRRVLAALQKQLTVRERFQARHWLPHEVMSFWPVDENAPLQT